MKFKFLHIADVHIGIKINNQNFSLREREKKRLEIWETFEKIIKLANGKNIDYLFISGDLTSLDYCNFKDIKRISNLFAQLKNTQVVMCLGNKDFYEITNLYGYVEWPENIHIFKNVECVENIEFPKHNLVITSLSNEDSGISQKSDELYKYNIDESKTNFLLLHANLLDADDKKMYINPENLRSKFDYTALGHIHTYTKLNDNMIYPGTPEAFDFDDSNASHGIIYGEFDDAFGLMTEFIPISSRKFVVKEIVLKEEYDFNKILDVIKSVDNEDVDIMKDYVKIKLGGVISKDVSIEDIKNEAKQFFYHIEFEDEFIFEKNLASSEYKLDGNIIDNYIMQFEKNDMTDKVYEKAFELGLRILKSEEAGI